MLPYTDADVDGTLRVQLEEGRGARAARLLHHRQLVDDLEVDAKGAGNTFTGRSRWPMTLLLLLTGIGLVCCALAAWWFSPGSCQRSPELADDQSSLSAYENLANSLRDSLSVTSFPASSTISSRTVHCDTDSVFTIQLDVDGGADCVTSTTNSSEIGTATKSSRESCISHDDSNQSEA